MHDQKMISRNISKCIFISVLGCGNIKSTAYFTFKMKKKVKGEQKHRTINKKNMDFHITLNFNDIEY